MVFLEVDEEEDKMFEMGHRWTKSIAQPRVAERTVECSNLHVGHNVSRSRLLRCHSLNQPRKTCARKAEKILSRCTVLRFRRQEWYPGRWKYEFHDQHSSEICGQCRIVEEENKWLLRQPTSECLVGARAQKIEDLNQKRSPKPLSGGGRKAVF